MTIKELITDLASKKYVDEDGDEFSVELFEGMTAEELEEYAKQFPKGYLPGEVREVLLYCRGFEFSPYQFYFDDSGIFEDVFPYSIPICSDGAGNFWIVDIDSQGKWNSVYYACHDPAVVVYQAKDIQEFLKQVKEHHTSPQTNKINDVLETYSLEIWEQERTELNATDLQDILEGDTITPQALESLSDKFFLADLRDPEIGQGFPWGKSGPKTRIFRLGQEPVWLVEMRKRGFFAKLFGH